MSTLTAIMKVTNRCNYKCSYCYVDERAPREALSDEVAELALARSFHSKHNSLSFVWHGGEPLLRGLDFYKRLLTMEDELKRETGKSFRNAIQTNAGLLTSQAVEFFRENGFHLGTSLDGPEDLTNATRPQGTHGSYQPTMRGIAFMQAGNMQTGAIATITKKNVKYPTAIYDHFKKNRIHLKVGKLVDAGEARKHDDLTLRPEEYGTFLRELFDVYFEDPDPTIGIRPFDNMICNAAQQRATSECIHAGSCHKKFISIAPNGDMYPCGYYQGIQEFKYGNVTTMGVDEIEQTPVWHQLERRTALIKDMCGSCAFYSMCHGGCPFSAYANSGDILQKDYYCDAFKIMFGHIIQRVTGAVPTDDHSNATVARVLRNRKQRVGSDPSGSNDEDHGNNWDEYSVYADVAPYGDYSDYVVLA